MGSKHEESNGALVPIDAEFSSRELEIDLTKEAGHLWTTLDRSQDDERALLLHMVTTEAISLDDHVGKPFKAKHLSTMKVEVNDMETGEVMERIMLLIMDDEHKVYSTLSGPAVKSLRTIISATSRPPWPDGMELVARKVKTRSGRTCLKLAVPPPTAKGKTHGIK